MYYIYHIPNVKIGCTHNLQNRLPQQTKGEWEILETHTDIDIASQRELELQKQYGYEVDKSTYKESVQNFKLESVVKAGRASALKSWQNHRERELQKCKKGGEAARDMGVGVHSLTKEQRRAAGLKGYSNGLGSLPKEKILEFQKKALKASVEKTSIAVIQCDNDGNILNEYKNQQEAARVLGLNSPNINAALKGKQKTCGGFIWKYKD